MKLFPIDSSFIKKNPTMYIIMRLFKIVLFMNFKTHSSSAIAIYELHILILRLRPISLSVLHKWNMSRKMTSVVCTNTFICMLWRKRRKKNVKRPDSPDVDREGGRPTKMWDIWKKFIFYYFVYLFFYSSLHKSKNFLPIAPNVDSRF